MQRVQVDLDLVLGLIGRWPNEFLTDDQLIAVVAIHRGDVVIRDEDEYMDLSLGDWRDYENGMILH